MAENSENGVVITNKDIYTELLKVKEALTGMSPQAAMLTDHEQRVRSLERWKYGLPASIASSAIAVTVAILETRHG
jgi:hypothetical protein